MNFNLTERDLQGLTDDQLARLSAGDMSALSDEQLSNLSARHELNNKRNLNQTVNPDGSKHINVANEMHPDIGMWDRFVVKNLGSNPDAQLGYMKKNYPNLEFDKLKNGELVARGQNEVDWKRLDEKGFGLQDISDLTTDIGQGVAEGVGGTVAGVASMNPLIGVGTAGAIGYGSELAKQGLGELAGIDNNYDGGNRAISGGASMAVPVVGKYAVKPVWSMVKKAAPYVGEFMSGVDKDILKNINIDDAAREAIQKTGVDRYAQNISDSVKKGFANARLKSGQAIGANLNNQPIDISGVKNNLNMSIDNQPKRIKEGTKWTSDLLKEVDDKVSPQEAIRLKNDYYALAEGDRSPLGYGGQSAQLADMSSQEMGMAKDTSTQLRELLRKSSVDPIKYDDLAGKHQDLIITSGDKRLKALNNKNDTVKYLNAWNKPISKGSENFDQTLNSKVSQYTGQDLDKLGREYQSWQLFQDPKMLNPNKTRGAVAGGAMGGLIGFGLDRSYAGGMVGAGIGGGIGNFTSSPWALKKYGQAGVGIGKTGKAIEKGLYDNRYIKGDKALINLMMNENER